MNLKPIRRRIHNASWKHFPRFAAMVDPGPRLRLWDSEFNLVSDSDRNGAPAYASVDSDDYGRVVFEPAQSVRVRVGGHMN